MSKKKRPNTSGVALERPTGWSKEEVLGYLEEYPGGTIKGFINLLLADGTFDGSLNTLERELTTWRKQDPDFAEKYNALMGARRPGHRRQGAQPLESRPGMEDWKQRWIEKFATSANKAWACAEVGVSYKVIKQLLQEEHERFDEEFASAVREVEEVLLADTEGKVFQGIEMALEQGDAKTVINGGLGVLERLNKSRWSRQESRLVEHTGTVNIEVGPREQKAIDAAGKLSNVLGFADQKSLPRPANVQDLEIMDAEVLDVAVDHG